MQGAVIAEVARRHAVHPNLLHCWRRQARVSGRAASRLEFLPVAVTAAGSPREAPVGTIEIELGGVRVRVAELLPWNWKRLLPLKAA